MANFFKAFACIIEKSLPLPYGLRQWVGQRLTAVLMVIYLMTMCVKIVLAGPIDFVQWQHIFQPIWMKLWTLLFMLSLFYHAWVGVRDIFMDYIGLLPLRLGLQACVVSVLLVYSIWSFNILWSF